MTTVVWQEKAQGVLYQVRQEGETLCLYANGVQHSEFHPSRLLTGSVWDLLWLPALLQPPQQYRRVLLLGLGGGTLVPPIRAILDPDALLAVELDPRHLHVALSVFEVQRLGLEAIQGDAVAWLEAYQGPPFDLIIEDLFTTCDEQVVRAVAADSAWLDTLKSHLSAEGMLVMNFADEHEYGNSFASGETAMSGLQSRFQLSCEDCHNVVISFSRVAARSVHLRRRLDRLPQLSGQQEQQKLNYHIRQLD